MNGCKLNPLTRVNWDCSGVLEFGEAGGERERRSGCAVRIPTGDPHWSQVVSVTAPYSVESSRQRQVAFHHNKSFNESTEEARCSFGQPGSRSASAIDDTESETSLTHAVYRRRERVGKRR